MIKLAFDSRNHATKLKLQSFENTCPTKEGNQSARPIVAEISLRTNDRLTIKVEVEGMLHDKLWCEEVWSFVDHMDMCHPDEKWRNITLENNNLAVELTLSLFVRLERLIESRVQTTKKNHWAWNFARDNFATMSRAIALQQHVGNVDLVKLSQNNTNTYVLEHPSKKITIHNENSLAEGACLFHDRVKNEWTRSRKCTGRPTQKRMLEHARSAESNQESVFCRSCPLGKIGNRGKCEWLDVHLGL